MTTSGTEEAVLFSGKEALAENAQAVLKPHDDVPLAIEFACPSKLATMSTFYVVPLPPVVPVGVLHEKVSYLRVRMPEGMENTVAQTRIVTPAGASMPLSGAQRTARAESGAGTVEATYALNEECEAFDGGTLEVAGFSYRNRTYPAAVARLQFDSKISGGIGWWPPMWFNGDRPVVVEAAR
ncbi:MAG TPA: hypothetical protein VGE12_02670 [Noviherbaspirillum sp.]